MGELSTRNYLNPLALEAQLFLKSLDTYGTTSKEIDINLCNTLEKVLVSIEKFLGQKFSPIVATDSTKLVVPKELDNIIRFYHCSVCKLDLGKSPEKAAVHLVDGHISAKRSSAEQNTMRETTRKNGKQRRDQVQKLPKKTANLLSTDLSKFFNENIMIAEKLKQIPEYNAIEKDLLDLITPLFPGQNIKVYKFGSRMTGIGTRNSDLDMFVDIGTTFHNFENRASPQTILNLKRVRDCLKKNSKNWYRVLAIESARVPILKVVNAKTNMDCDIGFSNSLGFCNTKLMEYLFELQPIARRLCIFLKKWLERSKLNDHFSTYSMSLMVVFFLQLNKHLPSIEMLQFGLDTTVNVGPWIANFIEKKHKELNIQKLDVSTSNCRKYILQFFEFYSQFKYDVNVICPYYGRIVAANQIEQELPMRYKTYVQDVDVLSKESLGLQIKKCMIIQDPIQLNHNVTKAITVPLLKLAVGYFRQSYETFA